MTSTRAILGIPGTIAIKSREFVVAQPTNADTARVYDKMRELAAHSCVSPLAYVNANADGMLPSVLAESLRAAIPIGSGGGVEPTREAVIRAYDTLEGVRFRLWYYARKTEPGLTQAEVNACVTEDERYDVADALALAQSPPESAGPLALASGTS